MLYTLNVQDVLGQLYLNNDGGQGGQWGRRAEEPFTGFYKQFSVIKNIHAGWVIAGTNPWTTVAQGFVGVCGKLEIRERWRRPALSQENTAKFNIHDQRPAEASVSSNKSRRA